MWQEIVVGLIVLAAAAYAAWSLLPATLRLRLAQRLAAAAQVPGRPAWLVRATAAFERAARSRLGGCSDCSAMQAPPQPPDKGHEKP
jgi:hypothetical protein